MLADRARANVVRGASGPTDPYWDSVVALLHLNGSNNGTSFTDQKGHSFTAGGDAKTSTAVSKFNGSSMALDGNGDYIWTPNSTDFNIQSGDFTAEVWVYRNVSDASHYIMSKRDTAGYEWRINGNNTIQFFHTGGSSISSAAAVPSGQWVHLAVARTGSTVRQFINGVVDGNVGSFSNGGTDSAQFRIGIASDFSSGFNGYMAEFRLTKGVCRYTATFSVPTAPYPDS
ncbi:LamG domain-containing protein [Metapseudomonas otitidis]|uniref:LamG domain-containing protein n=1 Tax=Metapseudomonas otitidis TaxID=319939 RepID=UPI002446E836|nr:LamG domain-containing protein [Pseudomonas otitidis]MDG9780257.1 LamG domain-containing protein [Pseudomonas otitidis]